MKRPITNLFLLKAIREKGWSQADLVRRAALPSEARLSRIIRNREMPTAHEIKVISRALSCSAKSLGLCAKQETKNMKRVDQT